MISISLPRKPLAHPLDPHRPLCSSAASAGLEQRPDDVPADEFDADGGAGGGGIPFEVLSEGFAPTLTVSNVVGDVRGCEFQGRLRNIDANRHAYMTTGRVEGAAERGDDKHGMRTEPLADHDERDSHWLRTRRRCA